MSPKAYLNLVGTSFCLLAACGAVQAADRFVSADGSWTKEGMSGTCYADDRANDKSALQAAINASSAGDTVWVKNDYVCDFGFTLDATRGSTATNRISISKKSIVVRGEDDDWTNGPIIRGAHDSTTATGYGAKSARCLYMNKGGSVIGFKLLDGSCPVVNGDGNNGGGAVLMLEIPDGEGLFHCLVANGLGSRGGGVYGGRVTDCVISNCVSFTGGGGGGFRVARIVNSIVCDNESTGTNKDGGGLVQQASHVASNCVIRCNTGGNGGGISGGIAIDCVITNNAGSWGGGVSGVDVRGTSPYKTLIAHNRAGRGGGGYGGTYTNCFIHSNTATSGDGGGVYNFNGSSSVTLDCCILSNNVSEAGIGGGAFRMLRVFNCTIVSNRCTGANQDGGGLYGNVADSQGGVCTVSGCTIAYNTSLDCGGGIMSIGCCTNSTLIGNSAVNYGGGAYESTLVDCQVISNSTTKTGSTTVGGGGIYGGSATRTSFFGNRSPSDSGGGAARSATLVSCTVTNNFAGRYGGGALDCTTENCRFVGNVQGPNGSYGAGGGAVCNGTHYNALFYGNTADNIGGAAYGGTYYNCTAYANTNTHYKSSGNVGGFQDGCTLVNCISYGNVGGGDIVTLASNSCVQVATLAAKHVDCVNIDPKFVDPAAGDYHPKARACRNSGIVFDWMRDPADVRSKDLAGLDRIIGDKPDMGCYETKPMGLMLLFR